MHKNPSDQSLFRWKRGKLLLKVFFMSFSLCLKGQVLKLAWKRIHQNGGSLSRLFQGQKNNIQPFSVFSRAFISYFPLVFFLKEIRFSMRNFPNCSEYLEIILSVRLNKFYTGFSHYCQSLYTVNSDRFGLGHKSWQTLNMHMKKAIWFDLINHKNVGKQIALTFVVQLAGHLVTCIVLAVSCILALSASTAFLWFKNKCDSSWQKISSHQKDMNLVLNHTFWGI